MGNEKMGPEEYLLYVLNSSVTGQRLICDCRAQSSLPDMVSDFLEAMVKRTGLSFMLIGGGPDVAMGGKVCTILLHTGQDLYGQCQGIGYTGSTTRLSAYTVSLVFRTTPTLHSLYLPLIPFLHMHVAHARCSHLSL